MEINITRFFNNAAPMDYSASVAEIGTNAGPDTWNAAMDDADDWSMLDDADKLDAMHAWAKSSGGWDESEIAAWSDQEINALFIQLVAGDMREADLMANMTDGDWAMYEECAAIGECAGRIFKGEGGQVYFYLGC